MPRARTAASRKTISTTMWQAMQANDRPGHARPARRPARRSGAGEDLTSIAAALSDPLIRAVMKADGVSPRALERTLRGVADKLARRGRLGEET
jgi:hypothetical protein